MTKKLLQLIICSLLFLFISSCNQDEKHILVFSKTAEFRHNSIEAGKTALRNMAFENNIKIDITEDAAIFSEEFFFLESLS